MPSFPEDNMAKLTTKDRSRIPAREFGEPAARKYPMPDRDHAIEAKSRATQQMEVGNLSEGEHAKIVKKADAMIAKTGPMESAENVDKYIKKRYAGRG